MQKTQSTNSLKTQYYGNEKSQVNHNGQKNINLVGKQMKNSKNKNNIKLALIVTYYML